MFTQELSIFGADHAFNRLKVPPANRLARCPTIRGSFFLSIELVEHLVWIIDRCDGLIRPGVRHARPRVGAVGDHHA